jgi:hypothetical protein
MAGFDSCINARLRPILGSLNLQRESGHGRPSEQFREDISMFIWPLPNIFSGEACGVA